MPTLEPDYLNAVGVDKLPGHLGIRITVSRAGHVEAVMQVAGHLMAPNGFLHAGSLVTLADTACGCGTLAALPTEAAGFTTIELKSNHLATIREGWVHCTATAIHLGISTQVWDAVCTDKSTGKVLSHYRCTQMVLQRR